MCLRRYRGVLVKSNETQGKKMRSERRLHEKREQVVHVVYYMHIRRYAFGASSGPVRQGTSISSDSYQQFLADRFEERKAVLLKRRLKSRYISTFDQNFQPTFYVSRGCLCLHIIFRINIEKTIWKTNSLHNVHLYYYYYYLSFTKTEAVRT